MAVRSLSILVFLFVVACSATSPVRFTAPRIEPGVTIPSRYGSISVREVSLPTYAALEEIAYRDGAGAVTTSVDTLWADDPSRAITLELARNLARITKARVAPEPWPFQSIPDATVDVRVEEIVADGAGNFRLIGQYFIAPDGASGRESAVLFNLSVPYNVAAGAAAVPAARSAAVLELAKSIAGTGLR